MNWTQPREWSAESGNEDFRLPNEYLMAEHRMLHHQVDRRGGSLRIASVENSLRWGPS